MATRVTATRSSSPTRRTMQRGFPVWIVFLGVGFLVLLLAFLFWLLRRRAV